MKNVQGLVIALALGFVGALCNWLYLSRASGKTATLSFIKIKQGQRVGIGHRFKAEDLDKLDVPVKYAGTLRDVAVPWSQRDYVLTSRSTRSYEDNEVLLLQHLKTPGVKSIAELLGPNETARAVPVDQRSFVAERLNPGDQVSFEVPNIAAKGSTPGTIGVTTYGPFRVLAVGARTGSAQVTRASGRNVGPQNVITIRVGTKEAKKASELARQIEAVGGKGVLVIVHSAKKDK